MVQYGPRILANSDDLCGYDRCKYPILIYIYILIGYIIGNYPIPYFQEIPSGAGDFWGAADLAEEVRCSWGQKPTWRIPRFLTWASPEFTWDVPCDSMLCLFSEWDLMFLFWIWFTLAQNMNWMGFEEISLDSPGDSSGDSTVCYWTWPI